ncbi:bifunctional ADP-dependent NAD(P)H-hydrate dehydratase/NAD(P)H-hydrate epimerase, partial [Jiangella ureilytica]
MARLPAGALMQRAVAGLVTVCARLLREAGGVYGARVVVLAGGGNNGGDALWAGARLARRGAHADAVLLDPAKAHAEGLAAFRA